jgi:hypothetical protein
MPSGPGAGRDKEDDDSGKAQNGFSLEEVLHLGGSKRISDPLLLLTQCGRYSISGRKHLGPNFVALVL